MSSNRPKTGAPALRLVTEPPLDDLCVRLPPLLPEQALQIARSVERDPHGHAEAHNFAQLLDALRLTG
jgi:hypothetical protein